ncbi:hypothetical protein OG21DRAFT_1219920 [Imleria badia]|nr:hypothetical protein OG21DRAFT_1219920 [Imleria badia]
MTTVETATSTPTFTVEPLDDHASAVRFEPQCVVIPDHAHRSRRPRVVTKSYALPLWKRRTSPARPSATSAPPEDEENQSHLVLRVPLPTFSRKPHSATRSVDHTPLPPCLVHRAQQASESSCASSPPLARHTRSSRKPSPSPSRSDIVTVPLRPCCAACQSVTEAALVGGDAWPEYFSRAASRRRSLSTDGSPRTITVAGSAASASYGNLGVSISVDEIDKRRRSSDTGPSTTSHATLSDDPIPKEEYRLPFILRRTAAVSSSSAADARSPPSPTCITPATPLPRRLVYPNFPSRRRTWPYPRIRRVHHHPVSCPHSLPYLVASVPGRLSLAFRLSHLLQQTLLRIVPHPRHPIPPDVLFRQTSSPPRLRRPRRRIHPRRHPQCPLPRIRKSRFQCRVRGISLQTCYVGLGLGR